MIVYCMQVQLQQESNSKGKIAENARDGITNIQPCFTAVAES